jgi:hypothetical protein
MIVLGAVLARTSQAFSPHEVLRQDTPGRTIGAAIGAWLADLTASLGF